MGIPRWMREQIIESFKRVQKVPDDLVDHLRAQDVVVIGLQSQITAQNGQITALEARIAALERRP